MKLRKDKPPIMAAGGIVLRGDRKPQVAIVQLRKPGGWVLPKGKLNEDENAIAAARREVLEETGHRVSIHEFLGTLAYEVSGRPKVVQFWRMQAIGGPVRALMRDVKAMQWLPLEDAIAQLTHVRERVFLEHVGPIAVRSAELSARKSMSGARAVRKSTIGREQPAMPDAVEPAEPFLPVDLTADPAPIAGPDPLEGVDPAQASGDRGDAPCRATAPLDFADDVAPCGQSDLTAPSSPSWRADIAEPADAATARNLVEKAWTWFRHTTLPNRPMRD